MVIEECGLDAYFLMRFLWMMFRIFTVLSAMVAPLLVPLSIYFGEDGGISGMDKLSWANVGSSDTQIHWAHLHQLLALDSGG